MNSWKVIPRTMAAMKLQKVIGSWTASSRRAPSVLKFRSRRMMKKMRSGLEVNGLPPTPRATT
jgi:hypothetical protein